MIDLNREIRPEDFAPPQNEIYCSDVPESVAMYKEKVRQREELERLYHLQEEAKAKAHFQREQARKDAIPFSEKLAMEICGRISGGEFLINICKDPDMPTVRIVNHWLKERHDFKALHDEAVNDRLNIFEDEVITIPDAAGKDFEEVKLKGVIRKVLDPTKITSAKLRVEVRRAHLKAYRPEKWGDQSTIITKNIDDVSEMSADELEKRIADLEDKDTVVKESKAA
jgi:hypothetical protein